MFVRSGALSNCESVTYIDEVLEVIWANSVYSCPDLGRWESFQRELGDNTKVAESTLQGPKRSALSIAVTVRIVPFAMTTW